MVNVATCFILVENSHFDSVQIQFDYLDYKYCFIITEIRIETLLLDMLIAWNSAYSSQFLRTDIHLVTLCSSYHLQFIFGPLKQ